MTTPVLIDAAVSTENLVALLRRMVECGADLQMDSRSIQPGDVFVACPGVVGDGRAYLQQAIAKGAAALLIHAEHESEAKSALTVPSLCVKDLVARLGEIADVWYGKPSASLEVVALTGTNGKTSCAQWLMDALQSAGIATGSIGTLGVKYPDGSSGQAELTTPDVVSMHRSLARLRDAGARYAVIEASSIGLAQGRLKAVRLNAAAFTNLSRDHLDYHKTMDAYEQAKAQLFAWPDLKHRIVNADDAAGRRLIAQWAPAVTRYGFATDAGQADYTAKSIHLESAGLTFTLQQGAAQVQIRTQLLGEHNVSNLLCVAAVLGANGWTLEQIAKSFVALRPVDGRLQQVLPVMHPGQTPLVVVDYAHTPDALERALEALRPLAAQRQGQLWCVVGCGGQRDAGKRPLMGEIGQRLATQLVVTSDNPRDENPEAIVEAIVAGLDKNGRSVKVEVDRAQAILSAVLQADVRDVVLIAGKGHETYQEIAGVRHPFDDRQWAQAGLLLKQGGKIQTDSRKLEPNAVFLALRGEKFDGHDYLGQVAEAGAIAAIVDSANTAVALPQVVLGDTRAALLQLGRAWRRQFSIPVVAVAGSNGKTTTKEMVASILAVWKGEQHRLATAGNLNNELGVPLTLLRLNQTHQAAVIEMGMNHPGEIAVLAKATEPTVALVNNAQREHQEFMVSVQAVAEENGQVFAHFGPAGVAVYPADDDFSSLWDRMSGQHTKLRFGLSREAEVWAEQVRSDVLGSVFELHTPSGQAQVALPVPGLHNVRNALAAAACALAAGAPLADVVSGLAGFHAVSGRMQPHRLPGGVVLIDDTYNANPDSVRAAIDVLTALPAPRVLVLGDMGEVGDNGPEMHHEVGAYAKQKGIEFLLTLGQATRESANAFGAQAKAFDDIDALQVELEKIAAQSLLIKGSRFMRMERVVRGCLARFGMVPGELVAHAV